MAARDWKTYRDFVLKIEPVEPAGAGAPAYRVEAQGPSGEGEATFTLPFDLKDLEIFLLKVGRPRRIGSRGRIEQPVLPAQVFGEQLFNAVFQGPVRDLFRTACSDAEKDECGLRLRLRLVGVPELADLPWEYLFNRPDFLALSTSTPLVRYIDLPSPPRPLAVILPLRILVTISSPQGLPELDVAAEQAKIQAALQGLIAGGQIEIDFSPEATLPALQRALRQARSRGRPYHAWHFIGHGVVDAGDQAGQLALCDAEGRLSPADGMQLGTLFGDYPELRLVVLNACEGARNGRQDPFSGVAAALVGRDIPAVIAMQFEISDEAAVVFAEGFYTALVDGLPVDAALTEARRSIFFMPNWVEWATPVLFMRSPDGVLFKIQPRPAEAPGPPASGPGQPAETVVAPARVVAPAPGGIAHAASAPGGAAAYPAGTTGTGISGTRDGRIAGLPRWAPWAGLLAVLVLVLALAIRGFSPGGTASPSPTLPAAALASDTPGLPVAVIDASNTPAITPSIAATDTPPPTEALLVSDDDQDGLSNQQEMELGTSPTHPDTDGDGIPDGVDTQPRRDNRPDLIVTDLKLEPPSAQRLELVTVSLRIANEGLSDSGPFHWQWFAAGRTLGLEGNVGGLGAGKDIHVGGTYRYQGCAQYETTARLDVDGNVVEAQETNNDLQVPFPVGCLAHVSFDRYPDGSPIGGVTRLMGDEFAEYGFHLRSVATGGYGEGSVPYILTPGYAGTTTNFLTTGNPDNPPAPTAGPFPIEINFDPPISRVSIFFRGASTAYELHAYDSRGVEVGAASQDAVMNGGTFAITVAIRERLISKVVFGVPRAATIIEAIEFE